MKGDKTTGDTHLMYCTCEHKDQDARYGKKVRVHNKTSKGYRCTVCKKDK